MNIDQSLDIIKAVIVDRIYNNKFEVIQTTVSRAESTCMYSMIKIKVICNENFMPEIDIIIKKDFLYIYSPRQFPVKFTYTEKVAISIHKKLSEIVSKKRDHDTFLKVSNEHFLDKINNELKTK